MRIKNTFYEVIINSKLMTIAPCSPRWPAEDGWLLPSIILILNPGHVSLWDEEEFGREEGGGLLHRRMVDVIPQHEAAHAERRRRKLLTSCSSVFHLSNYTFFFRCDRSEFYVISCYLFLCVWEMWLLCKVIFTAFEFYYTLYMLTVLTWKVSCVL